MPGRLRSPFGNILRAYRQTRGLSQAALADLTVIRNADPSNTSSLGVISEKTIATLESLRDEGAKFVRPRPATVRLLAAALDISEGSREEERFFAAAEETRGAKGGKSAPPARGSSPTFIREGRDDLLEHLEDASNAARAGTPGIRLLAGDAGTGKTHMIHELCRMTREHTPRVIIAWGECTSGAASVEPYLPFVQALNHLLGLTGHSSDSTTRERQYECLQELLTIAPDLIGTFVDEAALMVHADLLANEHPDVPDTLRRVTSQRRRTDTAGRFDQMVRFLTAITKAAPLVLVLEDLHWADDRTGALLLHILRQLKNADDVPLLIIGSYRPSDFTLQESSSRHPMESVMNEVGRQSDNVVVDLSSTIGTQRGRAFVTGLLHHLPISATEELTSFLYDRTEGHPLFSVELLRWLRETDRLKQDAVGTWTLTSTAVNGYAPGKIHAVIRERIERLPKHLRRILEVASVQGNAFMVDVLMETGALAMDSLPDIIDDQLVRRFRLLSSREPSTVNGRRLHVYAFEHALFRDYVYDSLTIRDRERLHAATAQASIDVIGDGPHAASGEISFHFARAFKHGEAALHAYHAGGHALNQMDYDLARNWFERAGTCAGKAGDMERMLKARNGMVASMRGQGFLDQGIELTQDILADARDRGFKSVEAEGENLLGQILYDKGQLIRAAEHLERAVELFRTLAYEDAMSGTEAMLSHARYGLGEYDKALLHARQAYATGRASGNDAFAAEALLGVGNCEIDLGFYDAARETYRKAEQIYARAGELRGQMVTSINTALCHIQLSQCDTALDLLENAQELSVTIRTPRLEASAAFYLGLAYEGKGDLERAERAFIASLGLRVRVGQDGAVIDSQAGLLRVHLAHEDRVAVESLLGPILEWLDTHKGEGLEDPFAVFLSVARAHDILGNQRESAEAVHAGHALLMTRGDRIADADARHSYLLVPSNRALLDWYQRLNHTEFG